MSSRTPKHPGRSHRPLVALATPAMRHTRLLGFVALGVMGAITLVILMSVNGVPFQKRYTVLIELPPDAVPVDTADQVRIAGQRAGMVKVSRPRDGGAVAEVELLPQYWPIGDETTAKVRVRPASGLTFIELKPAGAAPIEEGATIARASVTSGTTLPEAAESFDAATRDALAGTLRTGGAALAGQGPEINDALAQLPGTLDDGVPLAAALTPEDGELTALVSGGRQIARGLAADGDELPAALADTSATVQAVARRRDDLGATIDEAAPLLDQLDAVSPELDALMRQAAQLTRDITPATESIAAELPVIRRALASSPELRRQALLLGPVAADTLRNGHRGMYAFRGPLTLIPPVVEPINTVTDTLRAYRADLLAGVKGLEAVTLKKYSEGATAPGNPALRFSPIFTCGKQRNAYPAPGQSRQDAGERGKC